MMARAPSSVHTEYSLGMRRARRRRYSGGAPKPPIDHTDWPDSGARSRMAAVEAMQTNLRPLVNEYGVNTVRNAMNGLPRMHSGEIDPVALRERLEEARRNKPLPVFKR